MNIFTIISAVFKRISVPILAATLHELGHIVAIKLFGGRIASFGLSFIGARIDMAVWEFSRFERLIVYSAGAFVNIISGAVGRLLGLEDFMLCSFSLAVVNLLPIKILDGGCIISELLGERLNWLAECLNGAVIFILWVLSVVVLIFTGSISLWIFSSCLFVMIYLKKNI